MPKTLSSLVLMLPIILGTLMAVSTVITPAFAQTSYLDAVKGNPIADADFDGTVGTEWNDATHYTDVPIDPDGQYTEVWIKHDGTYLYVAIKFDSDSNDPWLTFQLGTTGCMDSTADVAIFGHTTLNDNGYSDAYFVSKDVVADGTQDGVGAMSVGAGDLITIEMKKPLASGDSAGNDIAWTEGSEYQLVIAWDSNGGGSSGGSVSHRGGTTPSTKTIFINPLPPPIPEFPLGLGLMMAIAPAIPIVYLWRTRKKVGTK
jgi:hypothetical protein